MTQKAVRILLAAILMAACTACVAHKAPVTGFSQSLQDPALVRGVLPNGFQYFIMKNTTPKERVSIHLNVFAGSVHETQEERGLAHFLEHMVFNGSEHFKPGELITYFQSIGMDFGGDANASTSFFRTVYDLDLPRAGRTDIEEGLLVLRDYAGGALLLQSEIDRERGVILSEKQERDTVSFRTFKKKLAFELPGSILARRMPIGNEGVIKQADRDLFKGFYDRWYRPDNMALVVVGDVAPDLVEKLIQEQFASLADRSSGEPDPEPDISWTPHRGVKPYYHYEPEAGNTHITLERLDYEPFVPETLESLKARQIRFLGDLMLNNRLSRILRDQSANFTSASVYSGTYLRNLKISAVEASCAPENWKAGLIQLENTLRQALTHGFEAGEFERVRADYIASLESDVAGAGTRKSKRLARSLLSALNQKRLFLSPGQRLDILKPFVASLDLNRVNKAFKSAWAPDHRLVTVTGNAILDQAPLTAISTAYTQAVRTAVFPYRAPEAKAFPYLTLPEKKAGIQHLAKDVNGLGVTQVTFDNNIRLNLKPTSFKKGRFRFKAVFGKGWSDTPEALAGFTSLVQSAVRESGLGQMDVDQLTAALAGRKVRIGFSIEETYFSFEGTAEPRDVELIFQLLYAYLRDPGFRENGMSLAKKRYRQEYEAKAKTPDGMMQIQGRQFLAGGNAHFGMGAPDQADEISMAAVDAWLRPQMASAPLEVSLVGDFDRDTVLDTAKAYLGAMTDRNKPTPQAPNPCAAAFPSGKSALLDLNSRLDKGMVRLAFATDDFWQIMQTRRLSMLAHVFSERLRLQIREELGASYSPYVYNNAALACDGYGVMQAVVKTTPQSFDLVAEQVRKIAADLAENGVTKEELTLVKAPVMNQLKVLVQNNSYWLGSVLADSFRHPEKLDWANSLETGYGSIRAEELSVLARKYLKNEAVVFIRPDIGPESSK